MNKNKKQQNSLNFDYSRISDEVSQNIREQMPQQTTQQKRQPLWKRALLVATYTLLVCAIAATSTWGIQQAFASDKVKFIYVSSNGATDEVLNGKDEMTIPSFKRAACMQQFDKYVCFGRMTAKQLMGSFLLSEADKDSINHAVEHSEQEYGLPLCLSVFMGEIDGVDYIYVEVDWNFVGSCEQCKTIFPYGDYFFRAKCFDSNLEYTLNDVVKAFEKLIGKSLTDEYLCALSNYSNDFWNKTSGINIDFRINDEWAGPLFYKKTDKYQLVTKTYEERMEGDFSNAKVVQEENGRYKVTWEDKWSNENTLWAEDIISIDEYGIVYTTSATYHYSYCEIFYTLYNNQLYVINRSYMIMGLMCYN